MSRHKPKHPKNDSPSNQKHDDRQEQSTNRHVYVEPGVQIDFVQDLKKKYDAGQQKSDAHSKRILFWTRISALLIFIYAALTWWQGCSTSKAANAAAQAVAFAQQQFRMDQRPYLSADPRGGYKPPDQKEYSVTQIIPGAVRVGVVMDIRNGGKSPAIEVFVTPTQYKIGPRDEVRKNVQNYVPNYPSTTASTIVTAGGTVNPYSSIETVPDDDWNKVKDGSWEFYAFGAVKYRDMFKPLIDPYETTYCYQVVTKGLPFGTCQFKPPYFGNSIK